MNLTALLKRNFLLLAVAAGAISLCLAVPLGADDAPCPLPETAAGDSGRSSMVGDGMMKKDDDDVKSREKKPKKRKMKHNKKVVCMDEDAAAAHARRGDVDQGDCD